MENFESMPEQFHHKFKIDADREISLTIPSGVFVPTGTTSVLIEAVRTYVRKPGKVLDLACGSGIVGIALHKTGIVVSPLYASDLSKRAIDCMKENAALYHCSVVAKCGPFFEPWENEKFDYIVDDISGISEGIAKISPWYNNVSCESGSDGTSLVVKIVQEAPKYLNPCGLFFFPVISFSNVDKILTAARENFAHVERLIHREWPLPKEMHQHLSTLKRLEEKRHVKYAEKFGMVVWFTDVYVAYNH